jgi:hypothetical protein
MISCRVLGPPDLTVDGGAPPAERLWRKNLALLVTALSPRRTRARTPGRASGATSRSPPRGIR